MNEDKLLIIAGLAALGAYYYVRAERLGSARALQAALLDKPKASPRVRDVAQSKYPFTTMAKRLGDPSCWKINEPGYAREGMLGLERRDYIRGQDSTVVTYTDNFVNV